MNGYTEKSILIIIGLKNKFPQLETFQDKDGRWMYYYNCGVCGKLIQKRIRVTVPETDKGPSCQKCYDSHFNSAMNKLMKKQAESWDKVARIFMPIEMLGPFSKRIVE